MKKLYSKSKLLAVLSALLIASAMVSCEPKGSNGTNPTGQTTDYPEENYLNYVRIVSEVLEQDAFRVYAYWQGTNKLTGEEQTRLNEEECCPGIIASGYRVYLEQPESGATIYGSQKNVINQIIQGCIDIATEVADAKIGEPYDAGDVYGVESWYSFNSFTDYEDNIISIENSLLGGPEDMRDEKLSICSLVASKSEDGKANADNVKNLIAQAREQLSSFTEPFRDIVLRKANGASTPAIDEVRTTIQDLRDAMDEMKQFVPDNESGAQDIINHYVQHTVIDIYKDLYDEAGKLKDLVTAYSENPTQENLNAVCSQWKTTRVPWELSEAFLYGPVANYQIDPHLDSWPLSQLNINAIMSSNLDWANEDGSSFGSNTIGFHTLEYLSFKDGAPRVITDLFAKDGYVTIENTGSY